jgi:hypothetical protein
VRESYLRSSWDTADDSQFRTEVGWPVFRTRDSPATAHLTAEGEIR